ncbi:MAG: hypothetical protein WCO25_05835 [Candidatus Uhrbacteria bacterium]
MRISIVGGRKMDWDELIYGEFVVAGRDFEPLIPIAGVEIFRGPMGTVVRDGDCLRVVPELIVRKLAGRPRKYVVVPDAPPVLLKLVDHRALLMPDESLVIADALFVPTYRFCAPGDNILATTSLGSVASD